MIFILFEVVVEIIGFFVMKEIIVIFKFILVKIWVKYNVINLELE